MYTLDLKKPSGISWKKYSVSKIVLTFHCLIKLFFWSKNFILQWVRVSEIKLFSFSFYNFEKKLFKSEISLPILVLSKITDENNPEGIIEILDSETLSMAWVDSSIRIWLSVIWFNSIVIIVSPLIFSLLPERCLVWKYCHSKADTVSRPVRNWKQISIESLMLTYWKVCDWNSKI